LALALLERRMRWSEKKKPTTEKKKEKKSVIMRSPAIKL